MGLTIESETFATGVGAFVEIICGSLRAERSPDWALSHGDCVLSPPNSPVVKGCHPMNGCPRRASCSYHAIRRALRRSKGSLRREMPERTDSTPRSAGGRHDWRPYTPAEQTKSRSSMLSCRFS